MLGWTKDGMKPSQIAGLLKRQISSITRILGQKKPPRPIGRPIELMEEKVDRILEVLEVMIDKAEAEYPVTLAMVMRHCRVKQCERTVMDALHTHGYRFHRLRCYVYYPSTIFTIRVEAGSLSVRKPYAVCHYPADHVNNI